MSPVYVSPPGNPLGLPSTAGTPAAYAQLLAEQQARVAADALKQDAATAATDSELASETTVRASADNAIIHQMAANPDLLITGDLTRDTNGAVISAPVVWPDGDTGLFTATIVSSLYPGAIDAYTITKGSRVFTQPEVTRDESGAVTVRPPIVIS